MGDTTSIPVQTILSSVPGTPKVSLDSWSVRAANMVLNRFPILSSVWGYESGVVLKGIEQVWLDTHDSKYLDYIRRNIDRFVGADGNISTYNLQDYNLDQVNPGKLLFRLYQETPHEKYRKALQLLRSQLQTQPRTSEGGFWHKKRHPYQMWLDGVYMAAPFYAQYADSFDEPVGLDDVAHQIMLVARHTHDPRTGLFYHGWDESKMQKWADPMTGCSAQFWGRGMGWYAMALVDVLDFLPASHQARDRIVTIFERMIHSLTLVQDAATGLWYQVLDRGGGEGNDTEAAASCMFVYAMAKGIQRGYLAPKYLEATRRGYAGILQRLIEIDACGQINLTRFCQAAGLGAAQQRDGSYAYDIGEPVTSNAPKGMGVFILASAEMEKLSKDD